MSTIDYAMPHDEYLALDALGSGDIKALATQSPAHFRAKREARAADEDEMSKAQASGVAIHIAIFEPHRYDSAVAVVPETAPKRPSSVQLAAKKPSPETVESISWWSDFTEGTAGRLVLTAEEHDTVRRVADSVRAHRGARTLLDAGASEVTLRWSDAETGAPCKARYDWLRADGGVVDLKSARDASPQGFARAIAQYGYHLQAAHYERGSVAVLGQALPYWIFIAVEKEPPYAVGCYVLDRDAIDRAGLRVAEALRTYRACTETGEWPAYSPLIEPITPPAWAI